jgi:hypothetical protein
MFDGATVATGKYAGRALCRHCGREVVTRPRGLGWGCYYTPGVKELYPSTSIYAKRGVGNGHHTHAPLPAEPTDAEPGSAEKVAVMEARAKAGVCLHHPRDEKVLPKPEGYAGIFEAVSRSGYTVMSRVRGAVL